MENYESKRKALFDCLDSAEKDIKGTVLDQTENLSKSRGVLKRCATTAPSPCADEDNSFTDRHIAKFRGKESLFKKPELPITKCLKPRFTPDYKANPHKWKKYSLSEVDISDHTNSAAAFAFLKEIETQRSNNEDMGFDNSTDGKITFNKSAKIKRNLCVEPPEDTDGKPKLKGSKLVMPEYVIGQKVGRAEKNKIRRKISAPASQSRQLCLSHLDEEDNDSE